MARRIAGPLVETLAAAGVERLWGVTGDSLNGTNDNLRRFGRIGRMPVRHEEPARLPGMLHRAMRTAI